jgi:shikimate dehydrogenase
MAAYGIIGFPLTHSFSKQYFTEKIEREGITDAAFYEFPLIQISDFPFLLKNNPSLKGLAVTIPYKEQVLKYIAHLSEEVKEIGAANCIRIRDNELTAFNTDITGFEKSFVKKLGRHHKKALILGSGGSSKAVQYVLKKLGIGFLVVSRNENSADDFVPYYSITEKISSDYNIIINCTPLGMSPGENTCPDIHYEDLTPNHYLYDLVYNPLKTLFLQKGEEQGAIIENGYEMLIIQAEENWKRWNED